MDDGKKENTPIVTPWNNPYSDLYNKVKLEVPFPKKSPTTDLFYNENVKKKINKKKFKYIKIKKIN